MKSWLCEIVPVAAFFYRAQWTHDERSLPTDSLLDMGKHVGGLSFKIWKNMQPHIKFSEYSLVSSPTHPLVFDFVFLCFGGSLL